MTGGRVDGNKTLVARFQGPAFRMPPRRVWPAMLLLGLVVALMFPVQMDLPPEGSGRSSAACSGWRSSSPARWPWIVRWPPNARMAAGKGSCSIPSRPTTIYLAKLVGERDRPGRIAVRADSAVCHAFRRAAVGTSRPDHPVAVLGNLGISAVGTLLSARGQHRPAALILLPLLVLPMVIPVVLAAARSDPVAVENDLRRRLVAMGAVARRLRHHFRYCGNRAFRYCRGGVISG